MSITVEANLVAGRFTTDAAGDPIEVRNPADDSVVGHVPAMGPADVDAVLTAAVAGARTWRATGHIERGRVLLNAAALIRDDADALTDLIVAEMGKTTAEARGEVGKAAEFFEYYGGMGRAPFGELLPDARPGTFSMQIVEPVGVVLLITPWNDPLLTPARKLAPALISGNAVVIKPATETPIVTLRLAAILDRAGLPAGVLGTVTGRGSQIGDVLATDSRFAAVSFTGSTSVGLGLQRKLAGSGVRVQTEMGGKNAAVVLADADLDLAAAVVVAAAFGQAGQRCTATSRLIVERSIASELRERVATAVTRLRVGRGDAPVDVGPVVSRGQQQDIQDRVAAGLAEGATVVARAPLADGLAAQGAFVEPLFVAVQPQNSLWREEVFGPVLSMVTVDGLDAAIAAVNDSAYGLSSAVFTRSLDAAHRFIAEVDTGQVSVNQPTSGWDIHQGFGGFKESGSAFKEQGTAALSFYTRIKTAAVRSH
ncbi:MULTISPECIES: aldehyde dehydrogenase family protein [unclassified Microbacterium]|uniref:aldehyde dehydrogenase family protein n=1 Tax=unclassified Microbacterium TaxID=2609290 RepID=UPI00214C2512|nr:MULTISPECIES: aldehyde dehydrogenase family protein [unclassified Microbacterium]MCR2784633.1 aldehyde dehydrogenase family protein [Microbacterium sp. zg.B96]WIM16175.1 aldehyde dehydrogenase family protein [Microbacterium sp. zg-B96]